MRQALVASPEGIARGARRRIAVHEVRRIHVFTFEDGDTQLVVRGPRFRLVHVSTTELADPAIGQGVRSLVEQVRTRGEVDPGVDRYLALRVA
jgi:hypothetical protein